MRRKDRPRATLKFSRWSDVEYKELYFKLLS